MAWRTALLTASLAAWAASCTTQPGEPAPGGPPDLYGVYQVVPAGTVLAGGLGNAGSPDDLALLPETENRMLMVDVGDDPANVCQPLGPFRMMSSDATKIEIVPAPETGWIVMLFENIAHGHMRIIHTDRDHPAEPPLTWNGSSAGWWEGDTLVVETVGFIDRTWLNDAGAMHGDRLRLLERIRPVVDGQYLEFVVRAEDADVLAEPYTYTRYYERLDTEIIEHICEPAQLPL